MSRLDFNCKRNFKWPSMQRWHYLMYNATLKTVWDQLCRGEHILCPPPCLKNPFFEKNIDTFFNYVNYSINYTLPYYSVHNIFMCAPLRGGARFQPLSLMPLLIKYELDIIVFVSLNYSFSLVGFLGKRPVHLLLIWINRETHRIKHFLSRKNG